MIMATSFRIVLALGLLLTVSNCQKDKKRKSSGPAEDRVPPQVVPQPVVTPADATREDCPVPMAKTANKKKKKPAAKRTGDSENGGGDAAGDKETDTGTPADNEGPNGNNAGAAGWQLASPGTSEEDPETGTGDKEPAGEDGEAAEPADAREQITDGTKSKGSGKKGASQAGSRSDCPDEDPIDSVSFTEILNPKKLKECHKKNRVYDRRAEKDECHTAELAKEWCTEAGIIKEFGPLGDKIKEQFESLGGVVEAKGKSPAALKDKWVIDQCGVDGKNKVVFLYQPFVAENGKNKIEIKIIK